MTGPSRILAASEHPRLKSAREVVSSPGQHLAPDVRQFMEQRFDYDFSRVRVHADAVAGRSAMEIGASAYTIGRDIVFAHGQFAPGSRIGRRLIAHELAHVIQQDGGLHDREQHPAAQLPRTSGAADPAEQEADRAADMTSNAGPASADRPLMTVPRITRNATPLLQRNGRQGTPAPGPKGIPAWTPAILGVIQAHLKRIGLYEGSVDRRFGKDTEAGLVEAFGGDEWRTLAPGVIVARLTAAKPPAGKRGDHNLRYGELFKDGLLDITLGVGYDENRWGEVEYEAITKALPAEGFKEDTAQAMAIYKRTGNAARAGGYGKFFVWNRTLTYTPPAAAARTIQVVLRVVTNFDRKHGAEAAGAYEEGLEHSDVAFYAGHGRFGTGPDFDPAMRVTFLNADGTKRPEINDYEAVGNEIAAQIKSNDVDLQWNYFLRQVARGRIKVEGENRGNIYLNRSVKHAGEFASRLMYWNLGRAGGKGGTPMTGRAGALARPASERAYRLWVFNGCRTQDYVKSIRSTPGADPRSTDLIATQRTIYWSDYAHTFIAFLRAVLAMQSAEQVIKEMDATNVTNRPKGAAGATYLQTGLADNPVIQ